jgi:nitrite reductase/ring-hydroxylating ferredoxin subunit
MARLIKVGTVNDLTSGQGKLVEIDGQPIALFNVNGTYHAMGAVCPHEDGPLHEGVVDGETIICPWHGYDFHVKTGECSLDSELRATTFVVTTEGNDLFIQVA